MTAARRSPAPRGQHVSASGPRAEVGRGAEQPGAVRARRVRPLHPARQEPRARRADQPMVPREPILAVLRRVLPGVVRIA